LKLKERKELIDKLFKVLNHNMSGLPAQLQGILLDDLVTAFESRINVLIRAQGKRG
jgi:hypothetical protein